VIQIQFLKWYYCFILLSTKFPILDTCPVHLQNLFSSLITVNDSQKGSLVGTQQKRKGKLRKENYVQKWQMEASFFRGQANHCGMSLARLAVVCLLLALHCYGVFSQEQMVNFNFAGTRRGLLSFLLFLSFHPRVDPGEKLLWRTNRKPRNQFGIQ